MNYLLRVGVQFVLLVAANATWAQPLKESPVQHAEDARKPAKEIRVLFDTEEHRTALTREIKSERDAAGQLNVLKACADAGIICGLELNPEMLKRLNGFTQKHFTLYSLFKGTFGKEAEVSWRLQEHAWRRTSEGYSPFYVLTIRPRLGATALDKSVTWNVSSSDGARWDTYDLGEMIGLPIGRPSVFRGHSGMITSTLIHMPARDALNHIGAMNETSWQVEYSSVSKKGKLTVYSGKK